MLKKLFRTTLVSYFFSIKIISNLILKNSTIIVAYHGISFQPSVFYKTFNQVHSFNRTLNDIFEDDDVNNHVVKEASIDLVLNKN